MRAIVTSSKHWIDEQAVVDTLCELPAGTIVLLPINSGACKIVKDRAEELKLEPEDWSDEDDDQYEARGGMLNADMLQTDIDMCFAFITKESRGARDCVRRARSMDIDVRVLEI